MLAGDKPGDNAQCLSLAAALGWPTEVKQLRYREVSRGLLRRTRKPRFPLDPETSSPLEPPWPDLVIGCGRRSVGVALEIRRRAGAATRLVQLGRPRVDLTSFDLVVTTPQYRLPERPNVLHLALPLHRVDREAWARAAAEWEPRFAALPRPRIALLVGGSAKPFVFDVPAARRLAGEVNALVRAEGGSLLVSTSRRTPEAAAQALCDALAVPAYVHRWTPGGGPNPYLAVSRARRRVRRHRRQRLDAHRGVQHRPAGLVRRAARAADVDARTARISCGASCSRLRSIRVWRACRSRAGSRSCRPRAGCATRATCARLHAALVAAGRALPLGRPFTAPPPPPVDETERAAARVRALFAERLISRQAVAGIESTSASASRRTWLRAISSSTISRVITPSARHSRSSPKKKRSCAGSGCGL